MPEIITRAGKASALSHTELDNNFEVSAGGVTSVTSDATTIAVTKQNETIECDIATGTITLPTLAAASAVDTASWQVTIKNINSTSLTVEGNGAETIDGATNISLAENQVYTFQLDSGASEWAKISDSLNILGANNTFTGNNTFNGTDTFNAIKADTISEETSANGVAVDGLTIKDSGFELGSDAEGDTFQVGSSLELARLGIGTAGQIKAVNSSATALEYIDSPIVNLGSTTASAQSSIDLFWTNASYTKVKIVMTDIIASAATAFSIQISTDGSTFKAGASDYAWEYLKTDGTTANDSLDNYIELGLTINQSASGEIDIFNPGDSSVLTAIQGMVALTTGLGAATFSGVYRIAAVVRGIRIIENGSGTPTLSGTITAYGHK